MEYETVPNIITGKDLDYLSDMFNWNYIAYKKSINDVNNVTDEEIKEILSESESLFHDNMVSVLDILGGGFDE